MARLATLIATPIATWFGAGYVPKGPGTAGSLAALICVAAWPQHITWIAVLAILPGIWAAHVHAAAKQSKDPQEVVVDEVVGQWIALAGATHLHSLTPWLIAFALFRAFDIWKPFPVRQFEKLPGGVGIVMDDVMAGLYAAVVMRLLGWNNLY
ncbi:MAG: phosphatidylglycerophosphatase A [Acidobacteria bacterium]|nr:phosphatidylglycerophosphatase A [Acidobacteriota bacterium]